MANRPARTATLPTATQAARIAFALSLLPIIGLLLLISP
jgi:hypothetical protein